MAKLGLPTPVNLERGPGAFPRPLPLSGRRITVLGAPGQQSLSALSDVVNRLGGTTVVSGAGAGPSTATDALVVDATWVKQPQDATRLAIEVLQPALVSGGGAGLGKNGRIVLLAGEKDGGDDPVAAAMASGMGGLVRSLAKELGPMGTTVNLLRLRTGTAQERQRQQQPSPLLAQPHAQGNLAWPLAFFLLPDSAFVSGQELSVDIATASAAALPASPVLQGRVCLVTGASQGIGEAIARRLAAEGATVLGVDLPATKVRLEALMAELDGVALAQDLVQETAPQRLREMVAAEAPGGRLDALVHNAGLTQDKTLRRMKPEQFARVARVNLEAVLRINAAFGLHGTASSSGSGSGGSSGIGDGNGLLLNPGGRVLLLASINGIAGAFGQTNYAFTKSALIGYAHAQAASPSLAERNITVNAIAPGFIETAMTAAMPTALRFMGRRANALNQSGWPEDIAAAAAFLCAEGSRGVNGQTLRVCGLNAVGR
jgi:3-oxoacyl-[acyl-carrier protein] reductase